ncbi:MAG: prolyl oligopeptidase family serine peptidase [Phycisphaerales bacterium]
MSRAVFVVASLLALLTTSPTRGEVDHVRESLARSAELSRRSDALVVGTIGEPQWLSTDVAWFAERIGDGKTRWWQVDANRAARTPLFDHVRVATALSGRLGRPVEPDALPIRSLVPLADGASPIALVVRVDGIDETLVIEAGGGLRPASDAERARLRGGLSPGRARTRANGPSVHLVFRNDTAGPVELRWVDARGAERSYATVAPGASYAQQTYVGHAWIAVNATGAVLGHVIASESATEIAIADARRDDAPPTPPPPGGPAPGAAPAGGHVAAIERGNIVVRGADGGIVLRTDDGTERDGYDGELHWSPDGTKFVAMRRKRTDARQVTIVESSPRDQVQPRVRQFDYRKPGDPIDEVRPVLVDVATRRVIAIDDALFPTPWSIDHVHWSRDSSRFLFLYNQRGHRVVRVLAVDAASGAVTTVVNEEPATFFDYEGKLFLRYLDGDGTAPDELVWMSERDGWNHLYLVDAKTGQVIRQLTRGPWVVRGVEDFDEARRELLVRVGGVYPEQDPYHVHFARVNLDTGAMTLLTRGDGTHRISWSPNRSYIVDTWSRVDQPPVTELRRASDGELVCELARADVSALAATGWRAPERFVAHGRDGVTGADADIWGVLWRPSNFDPSKRYAVIENIYAGPQDSFVPKSFSPWHHQRDLAELGFIVVQIDGMGTSNRSKAFHDVAWKNLKDAGFPDRVAWLKAAAAAHPEMDLERVGIYGGSAGGQNALRGMLDHPEMYKACVADCGCHDNRMDKIWWNELWMSWPVDDSYAKSSNVTDAHRLQGKLLLVVGELDENVDPASTMQVVDALVRADKDFELLVIPGAGHGAAESPYGRRRRAEFFWRTLGP